MSFLRNSRWTGLALAAITMLAGSALQAQQMRQVLDEKPGTRIAAKPPIRSAVTMNPGVAAAPAPAGSKTAPAVAAHTAGAPVPLKTHPDSSQITPTITWPTPAPINFGIGLDSTELDASASYNGSPVEGTYTYTPNATTILNPGTYTLSVVFTPTDTTTYTSANASVSLTVTNTPAIFWPTPDPIPDGTPLGPVQLNAQAYPNGTFTYSPAAGTVLPIGNTDVTVTFTPTDTTLTTNTKTRTITVTNSVAITWPVPAPIVSGTGVSSAVENATAYNNIPGTFSYSFTPGQIFPVGNNTLSVTFTPTDTSTYATSTASVPLAVYKAPANQPTSTTLAASATSLTTSQVLTLTSTTTQGRISLTGGTVTFYDGTVLIGTGHLVGANGGNGLTAGQTAIKLRLGPGNHTLTARFAATATSEASTSTPTTVTVSGTEGSTIALTSAADGATPANFDFLATVSGFGHAAPGGVITFTDQTTSTTLGTVPVTDAAAQFNFSVITTPTPTNATGIATADVNGDGAQDIIVVTYDSTFVTLSVTVSLGNGDGTFQPSTSYTIASDPVNTYSPTGYSGYFNGVAVADLNGDGYPDLVVTDSNGGNIDVLLGNGDGTFQAAVAYGTGNNSDTAPFPNGTFPQGVSLGDLNGDGIVDAVVGNNGPGNVAVMLGNGDGTFQASTEYANGGGNQLAIADFAGTGNLGVAVSSGYGSLPVFLGNGDGSLQAPIFVPIGTRTIGVTANDFNGDGKIDLAVIDQVENKVSVALGNGDGTFQAAVDYATSTDPVSVVAADVKANGNLDLVVANYVGTGTHTQGGTISNLSLLLGNGDGTFQAQTIFPIGSTALSAADLNGDGVIDLADAGQVAVTTVLGGTALTAALNNVPIVGTGTHTIQASYAPAQGSIYTASTTTTTVNGTAPVQKVPVITWPTPAPITIGTALSSAQLDASASDPITNAPVAGTLVYLPAAGTVLPGGAQTLSVTFTPTDSVDYSTATATVTLSVTGGAAAATLSAPATTDPGSQPVVTLTLTQAYPIDLTATFTLSVQPAAAGGIVDPSVVFSNGLTTYSITIPAGSTTVPTVPFAAGTVASTITVTATFTAAGANVTPTGLAPVTVQVPSAAPVLTSATLMRSGKVLTVLIQGSSSTRDMTSAAFSFTAASGKSVSTKSLSVPLTTSFTTWYQSTASDAFGSAFLYTQVFNLSEDATTVGSVSVTLTNSVGASNAETAQ